MQRPPRRPTTIGSGSRNDHRGAFASTRSCRADACTKTRRRSTASSSRTTGARSAARCGRSIDGDAELVVLVTTYRGAGAGTALLDAVVEHARKTEWKRLWLVTTNDNTDAIRLYQRAGWDWVACHRDAVTVARS